MIFAEFLRRIDPYCEGRVLDCTPDETFQNAQAGRHRDVQFGPLLAMLIDWCALTNVSEPVERAALVNALGPLRLQYMNEVDDIATYQALSTLIRAIDAAFDDEALETLVRSAH